MDRESAVTLDAINLKLCLSFVPVCSVATKQMANFICPIRRRLDAEQAFLDNFMFKEIL